MIVTPTPQSESVFIFNGCSHYEALFLLQQNKQRKAQTTSQLQSMRTHLLYFLLVQLSKGKNSSQEVILRY